MLRKLAILAVVIAAIVFGTVEYRKASRAYHELQRDFSLIVPPSGSTQLTYKSTFKPGNALIQATYRTALNFEYIREHYTAQLEKNGWQIRSEGTGDVAGRSNVRYVHLCKEQYTASLYFYTASLYFSPDRAENDFTFNMFWRSFVVRWR